MRASMVLALILLSGCASDQLAPLPPQGVDLSGHWKLDLADSDDPLRLMQSQISSATAGAGAGGQTGQTGGQGGRGRGGGGARGGGGFGGGPAGPAMPSVSALEEGLRWPGQDLTLSQKAGIVTFTEGGRSRMCRAMGHQRPHPHRPPPDANGDARGGDARGGDARGRDAPARGRGDAPPPLCGWDDKTLVVKSGDPEDDHPPFELRFSVSDDSQRLIEVVAFTGGRSSGFVASRVWDRTQP